MDSLRRLAPIAIFIAAATLFAGHALADSDADRVIAIDVLLLPDATMVEHAKEANAELRTNYPKGFTLGGDQTAHITLVHRYVHEKDLPAIEAAVAKVSEQAMPLDWELTADGYRYGIWSDVAITNIAIDRTPKPGSLPRINRRGRGAVRRQKRNRRRLQHNKGIAKGRTRNR
jgi:hypothetical protein